MDETTANANTHLIPPAPGAPMPGYVRPEPYPKRRALGRDLALAGVLLALGFLFWDSVAWAMGTGLGEALALLGMLPAGLIYLRRRPGTLTAYGAVCTGLYLLGALSLAFSADSSLKLLTIFLLVPLFAIAVLERLALRTGLSLRARVSDLFTVVFAMTFGRLNAGGWALAHCGREDSAHAKRVRAGLVGLICAVPALLILIPLLISSDAAFAGLVGKLDWSSVGHGIFALLLGGFTALAVFCLLFTSDRGPRPVGGSPRRGVEPAAVTAFLAAISAAYVLYLVSQFAYFTDAFRGLLPKDFTVAQYARRGFFEMCGIVAINLVLIVLALSLCRKEDRRVPAAVKGLSVFLCIFSLALVATALSKMVLYMGSFGLTRLRVLTSVFMIFLAVVIAAVGVRLFAKRVPVLQLAVVLGAAALILLSLANVDGIVARYNADAWRSGRMAQLDMETICQLGDGAVPTLVELAGSDDPEVAGKAARELDQRIRFEDQNRDLRSWNLIGQQARNALEDYNGSHGKTP